MIDDHGRHTYGDLCADSARLAAFLADRVLVMFAGRIVGEVSPDTDEGEIGLLMAGINRKEAAE